MIRPTHFEAYCDRCLGATPPRTTRIHRECPLGNARELVLAARRLGWEIHDGKPGYAHCPKCVPEENER
jgi:hypothetical protein